MTVSNFFLCLQNVSVLMECSLIVSFLFCSFTSSVFRSLSLLFDLFIFVRLVRRFLHSPTPASMMVFLGN